MIIGTVIAILAIKPSITASGQMSLSPIGFRSVKNTIVLVTVVGTIGFCYLSFKDQHHYIQL